MSAAKMTVNTARTAVDLGTARSVSPPAVSTFKRRPLAFRQPQQPHEQRRPQGSSIHIELLRSDANSDGSDQQRDAQHNSHVQGAAPMETAFPPGLPSSFGAEEYAENRARLADAFPRCTLNPPKVTDFSEVVSVERCVATGPRSQLFYGVLIACGTPCVMKVVERTDALEARQLRKEFYVLQHLQSVSQRGNGDTPASSGHEGKDCHPAYVTNIVQPFAFFETESALGLVTEDLPGPDLCEYLLSHSSGGSCEKPPACAVGAIDSLFKSRLH